MAKTLPRAPRRSAPHSAGVAAAREERWLAGGIVRRRVRYVAYIRLRGTAFHVVFIEHLFSDGIGWPVEPAVSLCRSEIKRAPLGGIGAADINLIDADGDNDVRTDIGAAPLPATAPEGLADHKFRMIHGLYYGRNSGMVSCLVRGCTVTDNSTSWPRCPRIVISRSTVKRPNLACLMRENSL